MSGVSRRRAGRARVLVVALLWGCGGATEGTRRDADAGFDVDADAAADTGGDTTASDASGTADTGADIADADGATGADGDADGATGADADGDAAIGPCLGEHVPGPGRVMTDRGTVEGVVDGDLVAFLGVPYAAPPVGELRWRAPSDAACWSGVREAKTWTAPCLQKAFRQGEAAAEVVGQEDCLYLNVWTPGDVTARRPVLVFIHGGGNVSGTASEMVLNQRLYEGAELARREDVVVVTLEYRVGPHGFLALPELSVRDARGVSGNYGLLDQIAALSWVRRNIGAFGGDEQRVLVFGESAGGVDTLAIVASPLARGLFARALVQSGGILARPLAEREAEGQGFAEAVGCGAAPDVVACLGALAPEALLAPVTSPFVGGVAGGGGFGLAIDGVALPESPLTALAAGRHTHVPIVIGANADETMASVPVGTVTPTKVRLAFEAFGEPYASALLALYPPGTTHEEARASWVAATTDAQFVCGARRIARAAASGQEEPVFRYFFTHTAPPNFGGDKGAFHGLELFYLFGAIERVVGGAVARPADEAVVDLMMGAWARFAASGDPRGDELPQWPPYDGATDPYLEIASPPTVGAGIRSEACDVWDTLAAP